MTEEKIEMTEENGPAISTIADAVKAAMAHVSKVAWGYDKIGDFLEKKIADILEEVPLERISPPPLNIVGPAVEALKFTQDDETLQGFFIKLIAKSLDTKSALFAHPSFINIIKNLSYDEGLILKLFTTSQQFPMIDVKLNIKQTGEHNILHRNVTQIAMLANCQHARLITNYLDNLCRLGLLEIPTNRNLNNPVAFEELIKDTGIEQIKKQFEGKDYFEVEFEEKHIEVTEMGIQFLKACVIDNKPH